MVANGPEVAPRTARGVLERAVSAVRERLPGDWSLTDARASVVAGDVDAALVLRSPDGAEALVLVEAKTAVQASNVASIRERLADLTDSFPGSIGLVVARYLSQPVRQRLAMVGLSYADATGNVLMSVTSPGLFIRDSGADSDPWRGPGRPRGTLKGEPAAKVVRALADLPGPWRATDMIEASGASAGSVYRVVEFLESEALATRDQNGRIDVPDWTALLRRWSEDYQFLRTNDVTGYIAPRGLPDLLERVRTDRTAGTYAVTGSIAAAAWSAHAPARSAMIYVANARHAAEAWDLRPVDAGVNVLLAEPAYNVVFERTREALDGLRLAAPTQVAVDLMTGPGRAPSEAEELLDWMGLNERSWR